VKLFRGQEEVRVTDLDMPIQPGDVIRVRERLF
jgi:hypothetical protein